MVSCDLSIVFLVTYEGSAFIVLFLDMRNVILSHFLTVCTVQVSVRGFATKRSFAWERTGVISGTEKLTVHTGPVRYRTSFGSFSHGHAIVSFLNISRQTSKRKSDMSTNFKHCRMRSNLYLKFKTALRKLMESFEFKFIE